MEHWVETDKDGIRVHEAKCKSCGSIGLYGLWRLLEGPGELICEKCVDMLHGAGRDQDWGWRKIPVAR